MVLAIGLVVDDAIVVVENVERQLEQGLSPIAAAVAAMREVTGPIIATTAVLLAVFVPVAFLPGVTGRLYNQFALTIAISVAISAFNSLTLSPALCAVLLRHRPPSRWLAFRAFNAGFTYAAQAYANGIRRVIGARWAALALFAAGLVLTYGIYSRIPAGFLPVEDQGYFFAVIQLPDGASLQRTEAVAEKVRDDPGGAGRCAGCDPGHRHEFPDRRQSIEFGGGIRPAEAMGRARCEAHRLEHPRRGAPQASGHTGRGRAQLRPAIDPGHRHHRRLRVRGRGSYRTGRPGAE